MSKDFLHLTIDFFRTHWLDISLASLGIFFIISYIILNNIKINPSPQPLKRGRTLVLETLKNKGDPPESMNEMLRKGFCKTHTLSHTLEKNCMKLSEKSCNATSCCVYAHNSDTGETTCVAGNGANGPTYKGDSDGNYYSWDYWYYLGKKYPKKKK